MGGRTDFKPGIENKEEGVKSRTNMHCGTCQIILMERKGGGQQNIGDIVDLLQKKE